MFWLQKISPSQPIFRRYTLPLRSYTEKTETMEIDGAMTMNNPKKSKLLSVEDYLHFFDNRDATNLTINQLNQIINMHGFRKLTIQKRHLIDITSKMEVMDLRRSTLLVNGSVSGDACVALEEVINDLKLLDWKECHVTSLLTQASATSISTDCSTVSVKRKGSKRRKVSKLRDASVDSPGTTGAAGSTTASLNSCK